MPPEPTKKRRKPRTRATRAQSYIWWDDPPAEQSDSSLSLENSILKLICMADHYSHNSPQDGDFKWLASEVGESVRTVWDRNFVTLGDVRRHNQDPVRKEILALKSCLEEFYAAVKQTGAKHYSGDFEDDGFLRERFYDKAEKIKARIEAARGVPDDLLSIMFVKQFPSAKPSEIAGEVLANAFFVGASSSSLQRALSDKRQIPRAAHVSGNTHVVRYVLTALQLPVWVIDGVVTLVRAARHRSRVDGPLRRLRDRLRDVLCEEPDERTD